MGIEDAAAISFDDSELFQQMTCRQTSGKSPLMNFAEMIPGSYFKSIRVFLVGHFTSPEAT
jgi:hypothetical protein